MHCLKFLMLALVLSLPATGCANRYQRNHMSVGRDMSESILLAVMPFQGVSESPGSGLVVADMMANELYALGGYTIITPEVVAARAAPREGEVLSPEETGKMVGAPMILTGRVTEYTYKSGVGEQPAVGITARLIEARTGRVLWSASRARTGSAAWFQEDSLSLLASRICRSLARSLNGEAFEYGWSNEGEEYTVQMYPLETDRKKNQPANSPGRSGSNSAASIRIPEASGYRRPAYSSSPEFQAGGYRQEEREMRQQLPFPSGSPRSAERGKQDGRQSYLFVLPSGNRGQR